MKKSILLTLLAAVLICAVTATAQQRNYKPFTMNIDVGRIQMSMNKLNGDGGLQSQFSWNLTGSGPQYSEIFYWPRDQWQSNMLYQIFNPLVLDDAGIIDENGAVQPMCVHGGALTNPGATDWASETRRYRPPHITVDGIALDPPYRWYVDPTIPSDIKIEFEDVLGQFGIRSHVEIYAFSSPLHADYIIWKATHKFTGELKLPRNSASPKDTLPDQTIRFWWPLSFSFGPSKAGEKAAINTFAFEGEDDLDSWFKERSTLVPGRVRDSLLIAYYWDVAYPGVPVYTKANKEESRDDTGDPDRTTGFLYSTQIPGFTLLHADVSASDRSDDGSQPYAAPHATIVDDLWGRRDIGLKLTYRGDDSRGRFPLDPITAGLADKVEKGPMRFITTGPYSLTKNKQIGRYDSIMFVYAIGVGGINHHLADSIGRGWMAGQITDAQKDAWIMTGRDSLGQVMDRANWAWDRISHGQPVPAPPPPPDIKVTSGPDQIEVAWSYPDASYFNDPATGVDDWGAWRVYRKRGALLVDDIDNDRRNGEVWNLVYETTNRNVTTFVDTDVQRGVDYYYAVTAVDNGSQGTADVVPNARLESSRYMTSSKLPATSYKAGLSESGKVRVVPNPATAAAGPLSFSGTPNKILFVNLPYKCTLKIFTETGDHVITMDHLGTADHTWDQRTDANQYVSSGIYILVVTNAEGLDGRQLDNQFVKFIIVR